MKTKITFIALAALSLSAFSLNAGPHREILSRHKHPVPPPVVPGPTLTQQDPVFGPWFASDGSEEYWDYDLLGGETYQFQKDFPDGSVEISEWIPPVTTIYAVSVELNPDGSPKWVETVYLETP